MNLKIQTMFAGINCKEAYEKIMNEKEEKKSEHSKIIEPVSFNADIVYSDYVQVPGLKRFVTAIAETDFNLNYEDANKAVLKKDLAVPRIEEFMIFHNHIIDCYKNKNPIFDAAGNPLSDKTKKDLYKQLTSNCWTWLNGEFNTKRKTIKYITGLTPNNVLSTLEECLEDCIMENCYADFGKLNKQGLATTKHSKQDYVKGENIFFYYHKDESRRL